MVGLAGLAFNASGHLFVSSYNANFILEFTPLGVGSVFATDPGDNSLLSQTYGLAFNGTGDLYATNYSNNTISVFTPDGAGSLFASSGLNNPVGLAFDSAGYLYAVNNADSTVVRYDSLGADSLYGTLTERGGSFIAIQSAPEPGTAALLGLGALLLAARRRRA